MHSGVSYVKKIPVVCTTGGSKDFTIAQYTAELSSVKVVTLTLGHPVERSKTKSAQIVVSLHQVQPA